MIPIDLAKQHTCTGAPADLKVRAQQRLMTMRCEQELNQTSVPVPMTFLYIRSSSGLLLCASPLRP